MSDTPASSSGFIKPAAGRFSSGFGGRSSGQHYGLDIAARGTVSVVAAASGTVTNSSYSSSYGNVVFITHNINGQTYQTVYAHLSTRSVSTGQRVEQGHNQEEVQMNWEDEWKKPSGGFPVQPKMQAVPRLDGALESRRDNLYNPPAISRFEVSGPSSGTRLVASAGEGSRLAGSRLMGARRRF